MLGGRSPKPSLSLSVMSFIEQSHAGRLLQAAWLAGDQIRAGPSTQLLEAGDHAMSNLTLPLNSVT